MKSILMAVYNAIEIDARVIRAAEALSMSGYKVTVISCNSSSDYNNKLFTNIFYQSKHVAFRKLTSFWIFVLKYCLKHKKDYDLIYMHDYFMPIIGMIVSSLTKCKWVYDAHELLISRKNQKCDMRQKLFSWLESKSIRKANLVITANYERLRIVKKIYRLKNIISVANISSVLLSTDTKKINRVVYQGVLIPERKVDNLIKSMQYISSETELILIGGGFIDKYKKISQDLNLSDRIKFTGRIPYSELLRESCKCKVGFVSYLMNDLNNYYCSPNNSSLIFE